MKEVEELRSQCNDQEKSMAKLRVDLKTLNYEKSQYAPMVKKDVHDAKRKAKQVSARGAKISDISFQSRKLYYQLVHRRHLIF